MNYLHKYINEALGVPLETKPLTEKQTGNLPIYLRESYKLTNCRLLHQELIIAEPKTESYNLTQLEKHAGLLRESLNKKVVFLFNILGPIHRQRLIKKGLNFIVPGTQLFLPELLLDLRENFKTGKKSEHGAKLLPSAQYLVIFHITHRQDHWILEGVTFKNLAKILNYTPMAITKAVENLRYHEVVDVFGEKEKSIRFRLERSQTWYDLLKRDLFIDPVLKRLYVDRKPDAPYLYSNASALPEYSDMNPSRQQYIAIKRDVFYELEKENKLVNANDQDGNYCLEVWKYDPLGLVEHIAQDKPVVDPLSLYLSLKNTNDERVEMALEQLIKHDIW